MRNLFAGFLLLLIKPSIQEEGRKIKGTYTGFWAATAWTYSFNVDNTFSLSTTGHWGYTNTEGVYLIVRDTIFIKAYKSKRQRDTFSINISDTLFIDGDSCLIQKSSGVDYCKQKPEDIYFHNSRQRLKQN